MPLVYFTSPATSLKKGLREITHRYCLFMNKSIGSLQTAGEQSTTLQNIQWDRQSILGTVREESTKMYVTYTLESDT